MNLGARNSRHCAGSKFLGASMNFGPPFFRKGPAFFAVYAFVEVGQ